MIFPLFMTQNIRIFDRLVRVMVGTALLTGFYFQPHNYWLLFGILPLVTGFIGYCGLYKMCGIKGCSSCSSENCSTEPKK